MGISKTPFLSVMAEISEIFSFGCSGSNASNFVPELINIFRLLSVKQFFYLLSLLLLKVVVAELDFLWSMLYCDFGLILDFLTWSELKWLNFYISAFIWL
jgi:hypothetical protein